MFPAEGLMGERVQSCSAFARGCSLGKLLRSAQFLNNTGGGEPFLLGIFLME